MKRTPLLLIGAVLLGSGAAGGWFWWQQQEKLAIVAAGIPAQPDLSHWPAAMRDRMAAAQARLADDPVAALAELSRLYHANGFFAEASQCYEALEQIESSDARWFHLHATILAGYGDTDGALPLWERAVDLAPDYIPARLRLGDVYLKRNNFDRAREIYADILAENPQEDYAQLGLARCEFEGGHWEQARRLLEPLITRSNFTLGYDLIATVYEKLGMEAQARGIRALSRASGAYRDPIDPWVDSLADDCFDVYRLSLAAGAADRNNDRDLAFRRLDQALALAPEQATLYFQLGLLQVRTKAYTKARENLERCTQLEPTFADGWAHLANLYETIGNRPLSDQALETGLRYCPASPGLHLQNANRLVRDRRLEESIPEFQESIRLRPNEADAYLALAAVLIRLDRREEGLAQVDLALVAEPEHPIALSIRTFDAIVSGNELEARQWLARVLEQPRSKREDIDRLRAAYREQFGREFR